jgi:hypothetical protein
MTADDLPHQATLSKPADLNVPAAKFADFFGEEWTTVLAEDRAASRHHFEIQYTERGYLVVDLNSTNGTFLDGRLRVSRDGGFTDNRGGASTASIIGDWQAEYLITEDGVYRLRVFNRNNFNTFTSLSLSQNVLSYGASVTQNVSFNSLSELFQKIAKRRNRTLLLQDSDDFLRKDYSGSEGWTPIDLEKLPLQDEFPPPPPAKKIPPKED